MNESARLGSKDDAVHKSLNFRRPRPEPERFLDGECALRMAEVKNSVGSRDGFCRTHDLLKEKEPPNS
jgi:hypothetical protein